MNPKQKVKRTFTTPYSQDFFNIEEVLIIIEYVKQKEENPLMPDEDIWEYTATECNVVLSMAKLAVCKYELEKGKYHGENKTSE